MVSRLTKVVCAVVLGSALTAARVWAQAPISPQEKEFRESLTPESWARSAEGMPKCTVSAPTGLVEQKWKSDSLEGVLSLPRDFHEVPITGSADGNRWMAADSSSIEVRGTHGLFRGGMGMGNMDIGRPLGLPTTCALTLEGRLAPSHTLMMNRPQHGDTLYVDTPNTVIRKGVGLQFIILTHSPAREAALLGALQSLKVSPPKSP